MHRYVDRCLAVMAHKYSKKLDKATKNRSYSWFLNRCFSCFLYSAPTRQVSSSYVYSFGSYCVNKQTDAAENIQRSLLYYTTTLCNQLNYQEQRGIYESFLQNLNLRPVNHKSNVLPIVRPTASPIQSECVGS